MQDKNNIDFENIKRMNEIAQVYEMTKQNKKAEMYHKNIVKLCDIYNIPIATNLATAELLVLALGNGELEWREM